MDKVFQAVCDLICVLKDFLSQGFGDPIDSVTDRKAVGANFTIMFTAPRVSMVILENTGSVALEFTVRDNMTNGKTLAANGGRIILDRFRGSIYAKSTASTTLEWAVFPWYKDLGR